LKWVVAVIGAAIASLASEPALADGYGKAKPNIAPAIGGGSNWSGLYVGVNAGWADKSYDWAFNPPFLLGWNQAFSLGQDVGIYGGHLGIQHQWGQLVAGVEVVYSSSRHEWATHVGYGISPSFAEVRTGSLLTIGPRLGWAPNNQWLIYGTGGYASANVLTRGRDFIGKTAFLQSSAAQAGYYLGGGVEYAVTPNIILGAEYQRIFLDDTFHCAGVCIPGSTNNHDISADMDIFRARLSFKLGRIDTAYEALK